MENKYYIIWHDYDGNFIENFDDEQKLEDRYTEIKDKVKTADYGVFIDLVIFGKIIKFKEVERVIKYLVDKE